MSAMMAAGDKRNHDKLAGWMSQAEAVWTDHSATDKMDLIDRWNFQRGLTNQIPVAKIRVVYAASGTLPAAMVLRNDRAIIEHKLYWAEASAENEAQYLSSILNSETTRARAEGYQSRGQFGARDFDKVIFNLPIPVFDASVALHRNLAALGARAEAVAALVEIPESERFVAARQRVRRALIDEGVAGDIEKLVEKLLDGAAGD